MGLHSFKNEYRANHMSNSQDGYMDRNYNNSKTDLGDHKDVIDADAKQEEGNDRVR